MSKQSNQLSVEKQQQMDVWRKKVENFETAISEAKKFTRYLTTDFDIDQNLVKLAREVMPKIRITNESLSKEDRELMEKAFYIQAIDNGLAMMEAVEVRYRGMMMNLRKQLAEEYHCDSMSEKCLVDVIVGSYARNLSLSKMLVHTATKGNTTPNLNQYISVISKEVDRANRQFITALELLKQLKQPDLQVNVKAKNAFISNNQQFNNNQPPHEINEPK